MNGTTTLEQAELLIAQLSPQEQLRLVAGISERLSKFELTVSEAIKQQPEQNSIAESDWMAVRGIAPSLLEGQDAQAWVSQTRQEADAHREQQWGQTQ
ncbi:MAG TPA: hypothetical protein PLD20_08170 [Blastocatellia bacterium]|nr:hypothetical protein [Blastocatellia bacterium]HMV85250.1 hypothetical protein [Blastocatellia bacterium]HMX25794.1 hypothetical protein [Blastocatellia bacterium]HMZ17889.1 hypothetical protein [Blastocatellia bacterium]HNG33299.1 hypothetical protein [Blastocatellia bacterium]